MTGKTAGVGLATPRLPRPGQTRTRSPRTIGHGLVNASPRTTALPLSRRTRGIAKSSQASRESCWA